VQLGTAPGAAAPPDRVESVAGSLEPVARRRE